MFASTGGLLFLLSVLGACTAETNSSRLPTVDVGADAGGEDAGGEDAGGEDAGGEDAGGEDAGGEDAGGEDAGGEDAGGEDAGALDAAVFDAEVQDGDLGHEGGGDIDASSGAVEPFFSDDFEAGGKSDANGFTWSGGFGGGIPVVQDIARSGTYSTRFTFGPDAPGEDSFAEQRFSMGRDLSEVWVQYYIYYPDGSEGLGARYVHRDESPSNNKFFRIWGGGHSSADYGSHSKVGLSTIAQSGGKIIMEYTREAWNDGTGVGNSPAAVDWGQSSDLGRWIEVRMHFRFVSGLGAEDGVMQIWKDGALVMDFQDMDQKWGPADPSDPGHTTWNAGYLLGWANSGFTAETNVYIDDIAFYDQDPGWN